ncbi:putative RNA-directed DNA polymerase [Tanacetum coccineum]
MVEGDKPPKDKGVKGGSSDLKLDIYDPLYLHPQDIGSQLITFKLEGTENYKVWSAAVQLALHTRNKIGFITGKCVRDENEGPLQQQWDRCNAVVLSWLLGCVSPELYKGQVFCKNSKNVWDELKETYDKQDGSVIYNLHHKIYTLTQSGMSLSEYYHECNSLWRQFDSLVDLPACVCEGSDKLKEHAQLLRLMQFLMGLDDVYGSVRSIILTSDPIPDVKSAFATLSRDESHRNSSVVSNTSKSGPTAFAARNTSNVGSTSNSNNRRFERVSNLVCKHCNMTGHTIERCFELVGYPPGFKKNVNNQNNSNNVSNGDDKSDHNKSASHTLTNDQYQRLMVLLSGTGDTSKGFASVAVSHPNGTIEHVKQIGNYVLGKNLIAKDVLVVPGYHVSLLSVHKLSRDNQVVVSFNDSKCLIQDSTQRFLMGTGSEKGGLYFLDEGNRITNSNIKTYGVSNCIWHNRLGHPADQVLEVLKHKIKDVNQTNSGPCDICHKAKQTREPFPLSNHKSKHLGDLVHLDVWGPYKVTSRDGFRYFLTVVDDYTRAVWVFLLKSKNEVFNNIVSFYNLIKNQFEKNIKVFRSDNGTEFINNQVDSFLKINGILHQTTCPYTPQQNGVAERKHRHLLNTARALMFQGGLPLNMWTESILTATYLINRLPTAVLAGKSPYELVYNSEPSLLHLRTFGCLCFSTVLNETDKFASKSEKCVFVGYAFDKKGYKLFSLDNKKFLFSRDVKFYETVFPFKNKSFTKDFVFEKNGINDLNFFNENNDSSPKSDEPYDDGGVSAGIGSKPVPETSTHNPSDSTIEAVASETVDQTDKSDTIDVTGSTSSRKVSRENEYATEADVSEGIQGTKLDNDEYESEGEDIESFGHLFGRTPEPAVGQTVRKSSRKTSLPIKYQDYMLDKKHKYGINTVINYSNLSIDNYVFATSINKIHEPTTYQEAVKDSRWIEAMNQEIEALNRNNTWEITDLPKGRKAIGSKWVWKVKYKSNGDIERFKARVGAKGFNQKEGIDYEETFSHVVKIVTVRCVLSIAIKNKWSLFQLDINNAFLYEDLEEEVYMNLTEGFCDKNEKKVCKLVKSLYGLKQAPRKWNEKLSSILFENGFVQSANDFSLFIKHDQGVILILLVYVDDIIVTGNNIDEINKFKQFLSSKFLIKDLGKLKYFLGIEVVDIPEGICLTQRKYCTELLSEFGMLACKPCGTPIESNPDSKKLVSKFGDDEALTGITRYQKLVGKLIYLTMTRPDISYAVHCLSQVMHSPMKSHLRLAFRVLRYLKNAPGCGITFKRNADNNLRVFVDSDWAKFKITRRSITGYSVFLGNNLVSWKSKKQSVVSRSSTEAEFRAMCNVCCEVIWIKKILTDLQIDIDLPIEMNCDNNSAIQISANPVLHERSKHFEIDLYFLREKIADRLIKPRKVKSEDNIADLFTKGLTISDHNKFCCSLGLFNPFQSPSPFEWMSLDEDKNVKEPKRRPAREWWKEEYCDELSRKKKKNMKKQGRESRGRNVVEYWVVIHWHITSFFLNDVLIPYISVIAKRNEAQKDFRTKEKELKAKEAELKRREQVLVLSSFVYPPPLQDVVPLPQPPPPHPIYEAPASSKRSAPPMQVVPPPPARPPPPHPPSVYHWHKCRQSLLDKIEARNFRISSKVTSVEQQALHLLSPPLRENCLSETKSVMQCPGSNKLDVFTTVYNLIVGAPCGVMDQMASACGEANKLLAMVCQPAEVLGLVDIPSHIQYMSGEAFLTKYDHYNDPFKVIDKNRSYGVKAPNRHPIYENFRVKAFKALLTSISLEEQPTALGELMYQCHYNYSACGLGSDGTDRLYFITVHIVPHVNDDEDVEMEIVDEERKCCKELKEALQMAMEGQAQILELYANLQEKHSNLLRSRYCCQGTYKEA